MISRSGVDNPPQEGSMKSNPNMPDPHIATTALELANEARSMPDGAPLQHGPIPVARPERRLLIRAEVLWLLHLTDEQVQFLINTQQLVPMRIAGEERFDSREIDRLIGSYMATARRRAEQ